MSDETNNQDVNTDGVDNVTDDHTAGLGSSAEDMETHNPDIDDYDKVLSDMDDLDDDSDDASGGTVKTDESDESDDDSSDTTKDDDKDDDKDAPRIPRSRLNEVLAREKETEKEYHAKELEWAREKAMFESRLANLEKPADVAPTVDPLDDVLSGEPQAILDAFQEDPAGFVRMIQAQAKTQGAEEVRMERQEEAYQHALRSSLDKFAEAHEDFMPNADKLVGVMDSDPIHNVISAYAYEIEIPALKAAHEEALTGKDEAIETAKADGIAEGRKQAIKEIQAKGAANVLDGSQSNQGAKANAGADLDTGGDVVKLKEKITNDLIARREAQG